jgi:hypothetical protein
MKVHGVYIEHGENLTLGGDRSGNKSRSGSFSPGEILVNIVFRVLVSPAGKTPGISNRNRKIPP